MATSKHIVLVTGANGGIGFELAAQLIQSASKHVLLGSRSIEKGEAAVAELQSRGQPGSLELLHIDVDKAESIEEAAKSVEKKYGRIDAMVNNAAIAPIGDTQSATDLANQMASAFKTNATGPLLVGNFFSPLLRNSITTPRVINISSGAGSITSRANGGNNAGSQSWSPYRCSKAALNMVTANQAVEYAAFGAKVFAFCPGFTVSNLSSFNKAESGAQPVSEGVRPIVEILDGKRDAESGKFLKIGGTYEW